MTNNKPKQQINKMKIKAILTHYYTKRDRFGNVYHAVRVTNVRNSKSFTVEAHCLSNVEHILYEAFGSRVGYAVSTCTESTRTSSLPERKYLNECKYGKEWAKALRSIGFRVTQPAK